MTAPRVTSERREWQAAVAGFLACVIKIWSRCAKSSSSWRAFRSSAHHRSLHTPRPVLMSYATSTVASPRARQHQIHQPSFQIFVTSPLLPLLFMISMVQVFLTSIGRSVGQVDLVKYPTGKSKSVYHLRRR